VGLPYSNVVAVRHLQAGGGPHNEFHRLPAARAAAPTSKGFLMLSSHEGQRVPDVTFKTRQDDQWVDVKTSELFGGKSVVVFSLPGAYTPTCSSTHLPRFNELAKTFKANGIDEEAGNITLIPDGNGDFTQGMGMLVDKSDLGFGKRSWRYSMLVRDGVVEKMFIEPEKEGDPFEVSDADTMLRYVAPQAVAPEPITIFTKPGCPFCAKAKAMLDEAGFTYEEIPLSHGITSSTLQAVAGAGTAPQVFAGGKKIGGSEDLQAWLKESQAKPDSLPQQFLS
jgi:glutaredoxin-like protein